MNKIAVTGANGKLGAGVVSNRPLARAFPGAQRLLLISASGIDRAERFAKHRQAIEAC